MTFKDYNIELTLDGKILGINPSTYSFSISDSIYNVLPELKLGFKDFGGYMNEFLTFIEGSIAGITLGYNKNQLTSNYMITGNSIQSFEGGDIFNPVTTINGIHEWYNYQEIISKAYNDRISNIIRTLANKYPLFKKKIINDTGNAGKWYQPLINDLQFIETILLPNSFSYNSKNTPFYCFVDTNNEFNFRNWNAMYQNIPDITLKFQTSNINKLSKETIMTFSYVSDTAASREALSRKVFYFNSLTGEIVEKNDKIQDYPNTGKKIPIKYKNQDYDFSYAMFGYVDNTDTFEKERQLGRQIYSMRNSIPMQKIFVTTRLNPDLRAGKVVNFKVEMKDTQDQIFESNYFSGKYLIESSNHSWNPVSQECNTQLQLSKRDVTVPFNYTNKTKLY